MTVSNSSSRTLFASAALVAAIFPASACLAQSMKPGLWEHSSSMKSQSGEMERAMAEARKHMASMPPEQRRQLEQTMGMQMGSGTDGRQTMRVCVTPEEATKFELNDDPNCRQQILQRGSGTVRIRFSCGGEMPSEGEGTLSFRGDTAFSGKFQMQVRSEGKTDRIEMTQEGRWIAGDCGTLKPGRRGPSASSRN